MGVMFLRDCRKPTYTIVPALCWAIGRGLHSLTSELNLRTFGNASLTLELNLSTFRTHPPVNLGCMGDKVSLN